MKCIVLVLAAVAFTADAEVLFKAEGDIKLRNRQSRELKFPGVDPAKGRVPGSRKCS